MGRGRATVRRVPTQGHYSAEHGAHPVERAMQIRREGPRLSPLPCPRSRDRAGVLESPCVPSGSPSPLHQHGQCGRLRDGGNEMAKFCTSEGDGPRWSTRGAERRSDPDITQQIRKVEGTLKPRDLGLDSCKRIGLEWLRTGRALWISAALALLVVQPH